jgi:hypothetical protein
MNMLMLNRSNDTNNGVHRNMLTPRIGSKMSLSQNSTKQRGEPIVIQEAELKVAMSDIHHWSLNGVDQKKATSPSIHHKFNSSMANANSFSVMLRSAPHFPVLEDISDEDATNVAKRKINLPFRRQCPSNYPCQNIRQTNSSCLFLDVCEDDYISKSNEEGNAIYEQTLLSNDDDESQYDDEIAHYLTRGQPPFFPSL